MATMVQVEEDQVSTCFGSVIAEIYTRVKLPYAKCSQTDHRIEFSVRTIEERACSRSSETSAAGRARNLRTLPSAAQVMQSS